MWKDDKNTGTLQDDYFTTPVVFLHSIGYLYLAKGYITPLLGGQFVQLSTQSCFLSTLSCGEERDKLKG